jgi:hypothetical protein
MSCSDSEEEGDMSAEAVCETGCSVNICARARKPCNVSSFLRCLALFHTRLVVQGNCTEVEINFKIVTNNISRLLSLIKWLQVRHMSVCSSNT